MRWASVMRYQCRQMRDVHDFRKQRRNLNTDYGLVLEMCLWFAWRGCSCCSQVCMTYVETQYVLCSFWLQGLAVTRNLQRWREDPCVICIILPPRVMTPRKGGWAGGAAEGEFTDDSLLLSRCLVTEEKNRLSAAHVDRKRWLIYVPGAWGYSWATLCRGL